MQAAQKKVISLQDVMNQMAQNDMTQHIDEIAAAKTQIVSDVSELDAFIEIDPLLASLHKEYKQAKSERKSVSVMFGANDPMTEVALETEDSTWCAMQTRYLELRREGDKMREAQHLMLVRIEEEAEEAIEKEKQEKERFVEKLRYCNQITEYAKRFHQPSFYPELFYAFVFLPQYLERVGNRYLSQSYMRAA